MVRSVEPSTPRDGEIQSGTSDSAEKASGLVDTISVASDKVVLIPQPSDDPRDPLNWPMWRKVLATLPLCITVFTGYSTAFNGQVQIAQQAKLYGKTTVEITYFNSATSGGLLVGVWLWFPISKLLGRSTTLLLSLCGTLATQIWACFMRSPHDYNGYMAAKFFMGVFAQAAMIIGPLYLVDLFFLHQRGRAFNAFGLALNMGASAGPAFSGFITMRLPWYVEFYWTIALAAAALVVVAALVEETSWDRGAGGVGVGVAGVAPARGESWLGRRARTFFQAGRGSRKEKIDSIVVPLKLAVTPVLLIVAVFDAITFGFVAAYNALMPVWLQRRVEAGGYGFSVLDNAGFTTVHWLAIVAVQLYGHLLADRLPLWLCARNKGIWRPEFRLHALWFPTLFINTLGLGFVGIALQYHAHWVLLAFSSLFVHFGTFLTIPITMNYMAECFRNHTSEAVIPLSSFRLFLGFTINFYITPWVAAVGPGWVYGMMAFFSAFSFLFVVLLMWKGHEIREASPFVSSSSEEGVAIYKHRTRGATEAAVAL